ALRADHAIAPQADAAPGAQRSGDARAAADAHRTPGQDGAGHFRAFVHPHATLDPHRAEHAGIAAEVQVAMHQQVALQAAAGGHAVLAYLDLAPAAAGSDDPGRRA